MQKILIIVDMQKGFITNSEAKDLSVRNWQCPNCHSILDRDINAAINIKNEGLRSLGLL